MTVAAPGAVAARDRGAPGTRPPRATRLRSTPARLTLWLVALVVALLAYGVTALVTEVRAGNRVASVRTGSGPLTVAAQSLYRSLSDADATAASAFLSGESWPADLRQRYDDDIASAGAALARASTGTAAGSAAVTTLETELPVYTGLVETARADNLAKLPVGAAYLREASALMRSELLVAAQSLYNTQTAQLAADSSAGGGDAWITLALGLLALFALLRAQAYLNRRTRRLLNPGLVLATLTLFGSLVWLGVSWNSVHQRLDLATDNGSHQVELLAQARIGALRARADEALTLVARGSGGAFETDYQAVMAQLTGSGGRGGLLAAGRSGARDDEDIRDAFARAQTDAAAWQAVHKALRAEDDGGDYPAAVAAAVGAGQGTALDDFNRVDGDLAGGIQAADSDFRGYADRAAAGLDGVTVTTSVLVLIALAGTIAGVRRRIAEYR